MLLEDNVRTIFVQMPNTIYGYTVCDDGFYTIVLNSNMNFEKNLKSYLHEIKHIKNGDFDKTNSASTIEYYAHV